MSKLKMEALLETLLKLGAKRLATIKRLQALLIFADSLLPPTQLPGQACSNQSP